MSRKNRFTPFAAALIAPALWAASLEQARVKDASVELYSAMSAASTVRTTLQAGDRVDVAFSIQTPEGEWCELKNAGSSGIDGYALCRNLERDAPSRSITWVLQAPPEPAAAGAERALPEGVHSSTIKGVPYEWSEGAFRPTDIAMVKIAYQKEFSRTLPLSASGETTTHRALGLNHRNRVDVAVNPAHPEGVWLRRFLAAHRIPYFAFWRASPGRATAAHIHIGPPSTRYAPARHRRQS